MGNLLSEGMTLPNGSEVECLLGEGAFAEVYRIRHRFFGRQALKIFKERAIDAAAMESQISEAMLLSRIGHPNIIRVFDAGVLDTEDGVRGYFTMEYVPGGTLYKFWQSFGDSFVLVDDVVNILIQICRGLSVAHGESPPIIHRDIKPQNILIGYDAGGIRARVSDFGLARQVSPLTLMASVAGTLAFKPPEAFKNSKNDSTAGDIYALGVTAYLLLTDNFPYEVDSDLGWIDEKGFDKAAPLITSINDAVDKNLEKIIMKCIALNPKERWQNAQELLDELQSYQERGRVVKSGKKHSSKSMVSQKSLRRISNLDVEKAAGLVKKALEKSRLYGELTEAADLMEEALNYDPSLRDRYADKLRLWRSGISM